jgi:hypothetical protein
VARLSRNQGSRVPTNGGATEKHASRPVAGMRHGGTNCGERCATGRCGADAQVVEGDARAVGGVGELWSATRARQRMWTAIRLGAGMRWRRRRTVWSICEIKAQLGHQVLASMGSRCWRLQSSPASGPAPISLRRAQLRACARSPQRLPPPSSIRLVPIVPGHGRGHTTASAACGWQHPQFRWLAGE